MCSQTWFPRLFNAKGERKKNCRGHGLYGPQFMRQYDGKTVTSCCCDTPKCEEIGYSHEGMMTFPTEPTKCMVAIRLLGIKSSDKKKKITDKPEDCRIAPWHYRERHRSKGNDGKWEFNVMPSYKDDDGKTHNFPPPNGKVQDYIDKQIAPFDCSRTRGGNDDELPPWVKEVVVAQEVASSPGASYCAPTLRNSSPRLEMPNVLCYLMLPRGLQRQLR